MPEGEAAKPEAIPTTPAAPKTGDGAMNSTAPARTAVDGGTPVIATPERGSTRATSDASGAPQPRN